MTTAQTPGPADLRIELTPPVHAHSVQFFLLPGQLAKDPDTLDELQRMARNESRSRCLLKGGVDGSCSARFEGVPLGTYTVCVIASAPTDPVTAALIARAQALYSAEYGERVSAENIADVVARVKQETGKNASPADYSHSVVRCALIEVTEAPSSWLVVMEG